MHVLCKWELLQSGQECVLASNVYDAVCYHCACESQTVGSFTVAHKDKTLPLRVYHHEKKTIRLLYFILMYIFLQFGIYFKHKCS